MVYGQLLKSYESEYKYSFCGIECETIEHIFWVCPSVKNSAKVKIDCPLSLSLSLSEIAEIMLLLLYLNFHRPVVR